MHITEITLRRVREVEDLTIGIGDRKLVPILGENGSGKSSILVSIVFALCGKVIMNRLVTKEQMVRDVGEGESFVRMKFWHPVPEQEYVLTRWYSSSNAELYIPGERSPIKGISKVNDYLNSIGLAPDKVERAYMPQGRAENDLFLATPGARMKTLQEIYGIYDCKAIADYLGQVSRSIPIDPTLETRLAEAREDVALGPTHGQVHVDGVVDQLPSGGEGRLDAQPSIDRGRDERQIHTIPVGPPYPRVGKGATRP